MDATIHHPHLFSGLNNLFPQLLGVLSADGPQTSSKLSLTAKSYLTQGYALFPGQPPSNNWSVEGYKVDLHACLKLACDYRITQPLSLSANPASFPSLLQELILTILLIDINLHLRVSFTGNQPEGIDHMNENPFNIWQNFVEHRMRDSWLSTVMINTFVLNFFSVGLSFLFKLMWIKPFHEMMLSTPPLPPPPVFLCF